MKVAKPKTAFGLVNIPLFVPFISQLKSFSEFPNYLTSFECFHVSNVHREVTLHNSALPRGEQVPIKLTDNRLKTVSTDIGITQCFQEWKVHNFFPPRNSNIQGSSACREDKKSSSERPWGKRAKRKRE